MKKFALSALLILAQISSATFAATFRNHEKTLFRPTICATLLSEFVDQGSDRPDVGRSLTFHSSRLLNLITSLPSGALKKPVSKDAKPWRFQFDLRNESLGAETVMAASRIHYLSQVASGVKPDQIVWSRAIKGKDAIKKNLQDRRLRLVETQRAVREKYREILPGSRAANVIHLAITGGLYAFLGVNAVDGLIDLNLRQVLEPFILYFIGYSQYHYVARSLQEMGMLPVESSRVITRYEIQYMDFLDRILTRLDDFKESDLVTFTDMVPISSEQYSAMKACNVEQPSVSAEVIAGSCATENMLRADVLFPNKKMNAVLESEMSAARVDPRWSNPIIEFDEVLIADPVSGEPVMVSFMVIRANRKLPQKKDNKPKPKEQEEKSLLPGYVPAGA